MRQNVLYQRKGDSRKQPIPTHGPHGYSSVKAERATITIPEAAVRLGISRNHAYSIASREGALAGVRIIQVGRSKLLPRDPFLRALGCDDGRYPTLDYQGIGDGRE